MKLSELIRSVAVKRLALVDLPGRGSNQHEVNGTLLQPFFEAPDDSAGLTQQPIEWIFFADGEEPEREAGRYTYYDARRGNPNRGREWRFYYFGDFLARAERGDVLLLLRAADENVFGLVFPNGSSSLTAAMALFGIETIEGTQYRTITDDQLVKRDLDFAALTILDALGLLDRIGYAPASSADDEAAVDERFGEGVWPPTFEMSAFARELRPATAGDDPDATLLAWLECEEALFRALERRIVVRQLDQGFKDPTSGAADVAAFLQFSLSVQNRRKSRMGKSLEHHLAALFDLHGVSYSAQAITEGKSKPDFIFPSIEAYRDPAFPDDRLTMLAAKSTLKDRWRQVLPEAARIPQKHLFTLQPAISTDQTDQIRASGVVLVVPRALQSTYAPLQRADLLTLSQFLERLQLVPL